jgi:hypothetical protein
MILDTNTDLIFIRNGKKRDRKRESVREGGWLREEVMSVVKMTVGENRPFGIRIGLEQKLQFNTLAYYESA